MYGAIWDALPGPWPIKVVLILLFVAAVLVALVAWVFPWIDAMMPQDVTVALGAHPQPPLLD